MQKVALSICIVAYKADLQLKKCLKALQESIINVPYEIIVVDNNESVSSAEIIVSKYETTKYIRALTNKGYGAGNNLAISNAIGEYVLVLNPDVQVHKNTIQKLYNFLKAHKKAAAVGTAFQLTNNKSVPIGTGELSPLRGVFALSFINKLLPKNRFSRAYYLDDSIRKKAIEVWSVAGSLALFRKKALIEVGGFDENLFLYFEENDIGRRLKEKGWQLWITNSTIASHSVGKSTKQVQNNDLKRIFAQSRQYYFRKHFGLVNSLLVEAISRFGKYEALLVLVAILGSSLRFYNVPQNMVFHGELGDNYLAMKNIFTTGVVPLLGPPTSHPWLSFGPLFYWVFSPVLLLSKYDPIGLAYAFAFIHSLLIVINYWTMQKLFDKKSALISSFIIAVSPAYLSFAHESRFFGLTLLIFYPFFYCFIQKKYLLSGLFFAILLNFHLTPIVYTPVVLLFFYWEKRLVKNTIGFAWGLFIGSFPFLLFSAMHQFQMIRNAMVWIPYRVAGFLGLVPKNNIDSMVVQSNIGSGYQFIKSAFLPNSVSELSAAIILVGIIFLSIVGIGKLFVNFKGKISLLFCFFVFGYIAIFIHGSPPTHYYLPLYPLLVILISLGLSKITKIQTTIVFIILLYFNLSYYFSNNWFYQKQDVITTTAPVPYGLQLEATHAIILDAHGQKFSIFRVGQYDQFEQNYSQNYRYLLWKEGNEPTENNYTVYTIYESRPTEKGEKVIFTKGGLTVTKKYEIDPTIT